MSLSSFHPIVQRWFRTEIWCAHASRRSRGWAAIRERRHTLIAAPTGSGRRSPPFSTSLDELFVEALRAPLPDEVRVVYVSPLKALSADIHKNLAEPRRGIRAARRGARARRCRASPPRSAPATRRSRARGDAATPPHILVTTPESLYLLLTAERSREMLRRCAR